MNRPKIAKVEIQQVQPATLSNGEKQCILRWRDNFIERKVSLGDYFIERDSTVNGVSTIALEFTITTWVESIPINPIIVRGVEIIGKEITRTHSFRKTTVYCKYFLKIKESESIPYLQVVCSVDLEFRGEFYQKGDYLTFFFVSYSSPPLIVVNPVLSLTYLSLEPKQEVQVVLGVKDELQWKQSKTSLLRYRTDVVSCQKKMAFFNCLGHLEHPEFISIKRRNGDYDIIQMTPRSGTSVIVDNPISSSKVYTKGFLGLKIFTVNYIPVRVKPGTPVDLHYIFHGPLRTETKLLFTESCPYVIIDRYDDCLMVGTK